MSLVVRGGEYKRMARAGPLSWTLATEAATSEKQTLVGFKTIKTALNNTDDMALVPNRGKQLDELSTGPLDKM